MRIIRKAALIAAVGALVGAPAPMSGQGHAPTAGAGEPHRMWMRSLGEGWSVMGMAQAIPLLTIGDPGSADSPLNVSEGYLSQPVGMLNLESRGSRVVLRLTPNLEGVTLPDGELTFGGWGEGFIDKRHPHTLHHEVMLSVNFWDVAGGAASISAGKGFAPYGTDDPMARPVVKYPTNHHLSQILERWTLNGVYLLGPWSLEAGLFGGTEPTDPYDLDNIRSFGDSWSARVTRRLGGGRAQTAPVELSASFGWVREEHHERVERTALFNAAARHDAPFQGGRLYALIEGSLARPDSDHAPDLFSVLAEARLESGRHRPYARLEYAARPEYERASIGGSDFFRYDHDDEPIGTTRWLITTAGYGFLQTGYPASVRPFVELQHHRVRQGEGPARLDPELLYGSSSFLSISAGLRFFLGGGPMRMGAYGVLDPMTLMHRSAGHSTDHEAEHNPGHGAGHDRHR